MLSPNLETNYRGNSSHFQTLVKDCHETSMCTVHKKHRIIMEDVGCQLHQRWQNFWRKCRKRVGHTLETHSVTCALQTTETIRIIVNSMSYNCYGTTSTQWSYSEKCWPCQDLNRNQVTKKQKQNRKKGRKKECEDRNRGVRVITKNFYSKIFIWNCIKTSKVHTSNNYIVSVPTHSFEYSPKYL